MYILLLNDYKTFLKHRHFYELHIVNCHFFPHPVNSWKESLLKEIFDDESRMYLIDRGFIPFALWLDTNGISICCFDTSKNSGNDYPVIIWAQETPNHYIKKYYNFNCMIKGLDIFDSSVKINIRQNVQIPF